MSEAPYTIVFVRHGESLWNKENKFCGWFDADLSETGTNEAKEAGKLLKAEGYKFDIAYTSVLKRAIKTLFYVQDELDLHWIPVIRSWRLNERHYGGLQGLNKAETAEKYGLDQVKIWRRSYDIPPPKMEPTSDMWSANDPKYADVDKELVPIHECLKDTVDRVLPFWNETIVPMIKTGKKILISAHGNSLRGIVKYLENIPDADIAELNIPTGIPLVYKLDADMKCIDHFYLGDQAALQEAINKVANQAAKK